MVRAPRVDGEVQERFGRGALVPRATRVPGDQQPRLRGVEPVDVRARRTQDVEVRLAQQRDRIPGPPAVLGSDQPEQRWKLGARVRMARAEEPVRPDHREAHRVLVEIADASRPPLARHRPEQPCVSGDDERAVAWIDPKPVDMLRARVRRPTALLRRVRIAAATARQEDDDEERRETGSAHPAYGTRARRTVSRLEREPVGDGLG